MLIMKKFKLIYLLIAVMATISLRVSAQEKIFFQNSETPGISTTLRFGTGKPYHFDAVPEALNSLKDTHPRLYMTAKSQKMLKAKMTSVPYSALLAKLITEADKAVLSGPPAFKPGTNNSDEQLWQRNVGNAIPELAMAYCITGNSKYLNSAKEFMLVSASYPTWGAQRLDNTDLATGHQLFGIALGYDWLYSELDTTSRDSIRKCLVRRGQRMFDLLINDKVWWHNSYLQNHQYVNMTGMVAAGLALYGGSEDVDGWILLPLETFRKSISFLPPDGANHEGIPYWEYAIEYLMKFMDLSKQLLGEDFFAGNTFFRETSNFRIYGMIPKDYWSVSNSRLMSLGDSPRTDWYGPDYLLRKLASEYNDGYAQWLANALDKSGYSSPGALFLNLLWINPEVKPQPPTALPLSKHFDDLDIVYMRSGWDGKESLSLFKCGPYIGHSSTAAFSYDPGGGHVHPDVNTFQIFSHGDWLISDEGYAFKRTIYQNTLIINGTGQLGEGEMWFKVGRLAGSANQPRIVYSKTSDDYNYFVGDATPVYPVASKLKYFYRHFLYLKPDCWIVADEVAADSTSLFEFYFHSDFPFNPEGSSHFTAKGSRGSLSVTLLKPEDATKQTFLQDIDGTGGGVANRLNVLKVSSADKTSDLFITVLESYPTGQNPMAKPSVVSTSDGDILVLVIGNIKKFFKIDADRSDKNTPLFIETSQ